MDNLDLWDMDSQMPITVQGKKRRHERAEDPDICMALDSRMNRPFHPEDIKALSGEEILLEILTLYYSWKRIHMTSSYDKKFERLVVYHMAKVCTYWNVKDSSLVAEVLNCIFHSEGHFSPIFHHSGDHSNSILWIGQWPLPPDQVDFHPMEYHTVSFFLYHANKVRMTFCGTRFVDRCIEYPCRLAPCYLAAILVKPDLLLLILQYGAQLTPKHEELRNVLDNFNAVDLYVVLQRLISMLKENMDRETTEFDHAYTIVCSENAQKIILCLKLLLRASGQLHKRSLELVIYQNEQNINDFFLHKIMDNDVVSILTYRYLEPCQLKHLTRCTIRRVLNENWQLPFGIKKLPLPSLIQNYLNLLED